MHMSVPLQASLYQHQQHVEQRFAIDVSSAVQKRSGSREAFSAMHAPMPHNTRMRACSAKTTLRLPAVLAARTSSHYSLVTAMPRPAQAHDRVRPLALLRIGKGK
jgi:hypothetical protein